MKKPKSAVYFGKKEEEYIKMYVNSEDADERRDLYVNHISKVFSKLVENIIFKYDFLGLTDDYNDLHQEVLSHLYLNIDKFNPTYGFKAYSYFGTAAKRYLQQKSINKTFENKNIDDIYSKEKGEINDDLLKNAIILSDENKNVEDKEFIDILINNFKNYKTDDKKEEKIIEAILYFLCNYENINIANKKHLYLMLREYTGLDTKTITKIMNNSILKIYDNIKKQYIEFQL